MKTRLTIVAASEQALSPEQKKFNQLLRKIDQARAELQAWQEALPWVTEAHAQRLRPLFDRIYEMQLCVLRIVDKQLSGGVGKGLGKRQRLSLREFVCGLAAQLIANERSDEACVAELKALHDRHADVDFETHQREAMAGMKGMLETITGADFDEYDIESEEALLRHALEKMRAHAEQAEAAAAARRQRRPSAAELRRQREEQEASQSVREVYRKLAAALHPDRASDDADRIDRTALMQRVNQAYEARDILALFSLQLEIEQVDAAHIAKVTAERARQYNRLLSEQLKQIQAEVAACKASLCLQFGFDPYRANKPAQLTRLIAEEELGLKQALVDAERDLQQLGDPASAKRWLSAMAGQLERDRWDGECPF